MYKAFLIKYAEIGVKGKNRDLFEEALVRQIKYAFKRCEGEFRVRRTRGRIYIDVLSDDYDYEETIDNLKTVCGVSAICPMVQLEDEGFDKLCESAVSYMDEHYPDKNITFKVNARRARKNYPVESMEINASVGEKILQAFPEIRVDVHNPDVMLYIEVREHIYIYSIEIPGPGGMPVGMQNSISFFGAGYVLGIPFPVIVLAIIAIIMLFVLNKTRFGRHVYALGGNEQTARLCGIKVNKTKIMVYAISGILAAVSGLIIAARLNSAQPDAGTSYEMDAIAAAVIGGCSMSQGGVGTIGGVVIGAFIIGVLNNALNLLNVSPFWQTAVKGFVILAAIIIDHMTVRAKKK